MKWLVTNLRILRPWRMRFLTVPEFTALIEREEITVREWQVIVETQEKAL